MGKSDETLLNDPGRWLKRAAEMRAYARRLRNAETRRVMLSIADDYERLAKHVTGWQQYKRSDAPDDES